MQYVKIKEALAEQIESGALVAQQKLPAERQLAEFFSTTRITLRAALSLLESEGKIYREDRRGWFISPMPLVCDPSKTTTFNDMALAQGRIPQTKLISAQSLIANKQASKMLQLAPFTHIYQIERVRTLEDRPVLFVINYVKLDVFPNLLEQDFSHSLTTLYREHYGQESQRVHYRISTTSLFGHIAQALRATEGSPATLVERINYNQKGELIDCDLEYWRHDAMCIESETQL